MKIYDVRILARIKSKNQQGSDVQVNENLLLFTLRGSKYAINGLVVVELLKSLNISPLSNSVPYLLGSTNFRGEIVPIVDLQIFFHGQQTRTTNSDQEMYIALEFQDKSLILKVESVIGTLKELDSQVTDLIRFTDPTELTYFMKAFIHDKEIIVLVAHEQILERITLELTEKKKEFLAGNQDILAPLEIPTNPELYNIDLGDKVSKEIPTLKPTKLLKDKKIKSKFQSAILVSVHDYDILILNEDIVEIFSYSNLTAVPNVKKTVKGAINYRGSVISTLSLRELLELPSKLLPNENREVIIFNVANQYFALLVDEIKEIIEIDRKEIRKTFTLGDKKRKYIFQGVITNSEGSILPILNNECIYQDMVQPAKDEVIFFSDIERDTLIQKTENIKDGLVFEASGKRFFLESSNVTQIIDDKEFLEKEYSNVAIRGATVHTNIVPLIDFSKLLGISKDTDQFEKVGILLKDSESDSQITIVVDNILGKISIEKLDAFQKETGISEEIISPIITGFFEYQGNLGMIVNAKQLFDESTAILKESLTITSIEEFEKTLQPNEREFLEEIYDSRKELELLLFYHQEGTRLDYFVCQLGGIKAAIDVDLTRRVFSSLIMKETLSEFHPFIGTSIIENDEIPILDLGLLLIKNYVYSKHSNDGLFLSLVNDNDKYLIPVQGIEGVITTFEEELSPCEDLSSFIDGEEVCLNVIENDKFDSTIFVLEPEFLKTKLNKLGEITERMNLKSENKQKKRN